MNKYQEALDVMDWNERWVNREPETYEYAKSLIQELVDRAIPKKPSGNYCQELCPNCGEESCRTEYASRYEYKHCSECGQALDWSSE